MIELLFLGVFGAAILGSVFFDNDDESAADESPDAPPEGGEGNLGQMLAFDGADTLTGTEGDDTLAAGQDEALAPEVVDLLGGDDVATIDLPYGVTLLGGEGDDDLTSTAVGNTLVGMDGDDTLSGIDAVNMSGGSGDDTLTIALDTELNDSVARMDGGDGDDTLNVLAKADLSLQEESDRGGLFVTGGEGADEINIVFDLTPIDMADETAVNGNGGDFNLLRVTDFDPAQDQLNIEIDGATQTDAFGFTRVEFEQTAQGEEYLTALKLYFESGAAQAQAYQSISTLNIISNAPFTLADIRIVTV